MNPLPSRGCRSRSACGPRCWMEPVVPGQPALHPGSVQERADQPCAYLQCAGALRQLPYAAQRAHGRGRRPRAGRWPRRAVVRAEHQLGSRRWHRRLVGGRTGAVPAHRPRRRQGPGRRHDGRGGREQFPAHARDGSSGDRGLPEEHRAVIPSRGGQQAPGRDRLWPGRAASDEAAARPGQPDRHRQPEVRRRAVQRLLRQLSPVQRRGQRQPGLSSLFPQHGHRRGHGGQSGRDHPVRHRPQCRRSAC